MSQPPIPAVPMWVPVFDPNTAISADLPCRKCAYNLRGLTTASRCPQCGIPAGLSSVGDLLRFADPNWIAMLARGLSFVLWGVAVSLLAAVLSVFVFQRSATGRWAELLGSGIGIYGAWLLTEPDPSGLGEAQYAAVRKLVRATLAIGVCGSIIRTAEGSLSVPSEVHVMVLILTFLTRLAGIAGEFATFMYLEKLADRIPDDPLAGRARFLKWAYTLGLALILLAAFGTAAIEVSRRHSGNEAGLALIGCFELVVTIAMVTFAIMTLLFYARFRRALFAQHVLAVQAWSAVGTGPQSASA